MSLPTAQKQWSLKSTEKGIDGLVLESGPVPSPGENEVLVKLQGASLNYRDLVIPRGLYPFPLSLPVVAASDGAGVVVSVGSKVTKWKKGDRVTTLFNQAHQFGPMTVAASKSGLGGTLDGTLRQYGVFNQDGLVKTPGCLSDVESATLVCAGLTSWNALYGLKPLLPGQTVLVQGSGGVSMFALQVSCCHVALKGGECWCIAKFAKAAGARVIATTSSADKAEKLKKLGADHVINYREDPNWGETARKLTVDEAGVDHIIEVGGEGTLTQSLRAVKYEGVISVIGFLGGAEPKDSIMEALSRICTIRGVFVGSRGQMEDMMAAVEVNNIHPVVDEQVFSFDTARDAYDYMVSWPWRWDVSVCVLTAHSGRRSISARLALRLSKVR
jgi:NADPH:quinone reductase-like Zn-dependent oxidoreductase